MKILSQLLLLASLCITWGWASAACAAEPTAVETPQAPSADSADLTYTPQWPEPPNTGAMLLRLSLGTVAVLVLCVGSLWLGKPWLQRLQVGATESSKLKIEGSVTLGSRAVLYLVKVGDTQLVAGTDATGLKSLVVVPTSFGDVLDAQLPAAEQIMTAAPYLDSRPPGIAGSKE